MNFLANKQISYILAGLLLLIFSISPVVQGSDLEREKRMANEIVDAILDGEPVWLEADGTEFLGIYTEAMEEPVRGSVVIVHGRGYHPDWAEVANPLRVGLAERGWNTLSLQMPVLEKGSKYYDYVPLFEEAIPRIDQGVNYLKEQGAEHIVLIAHSCGAHMAMERVHVEGDNDLAAYVGIGMGATDYGQPMLESFPLEKMTVPVLDIYGEEEFPAVLKMAPERLALMEKAGNSLSRQVVVPGSDHYFHGKGEPLLEAVDAWLMMISDQLGWVK
jgi:hypothetical protein